MRHDFQSSLARSNENADLPLWEEIYRKAFPGFKSMEDMREDGAHQRQGIDRVVTIINGAGYKHITIDEKIRFKAYSDIALEYLSDEQRKTPGWVCKPLLCDYICYAIKPRGIAYLLPVVQLQQAWVNNKADWLHRYKAIRADNGRYWTLSLPVPVDVLFPEIGACLRVSFGE